MPEYGVRTLKFCAAPAEIQAMNNKPFLSIGPGYPGYLEARALALSIAAIRKAQGKKNPSDYAVGSPDWEAADEEFARDLLRILGSE